MYLKSTAIQASFRDLNQKYLEFNLSIFWQLQLLVVADIFSGLTVAVLVVVDELQCYKCTNVKLETSNPLLEKLLQGQTQKWCERPSVSDTTETCPSTTGYMCSYFEGSISFELLFSACEALFITYIQSHTQSTTHGHTYACKLTHMCMHIHTNSHPIVTLYTVM